MKLSSLLLFLLFFLSKGTAQTTYLDSLHQRLANERNDTSKMVLHSLLFYYYSETIPDSALQYSKKAMYLATRIDMPVSLAMTMDHVGYSELLLGNYSEAFRILLEGIKIVEEENTHHDELASYYIKQLKFIGHITSPSQFKLNTLANLYHDLGHLYVNIDHYRSGIKYYSKALELAKQYDDEQLECLARMHIGRTYTL